MLEALSGPSPGLGGSTPSTVKVEIPNPLLEERGCRRRVDEAWASAGWA